MLRIALISPLTPSVGGMSVLAESLHKSLQQQKVEVVPINTNPAVKSIFSTGKYLSKIQQWFVFLFNLRRVANCKCAVVISSSGDYFYFKAISSLYICRLFKCKIIIDFVGGGLLHFPDKVKSRIFRKLMKFDHIIVPSTPFKDCFEKAGVPCTLFPHIVEVEKFSSEKGIITEPVFLSVKNLEEYSNIGSIIKAFALVKGQFPGARLLITGRGSQKKYLMNLVQEMNINNVEFLENLKNDEMPGVYARASVFLHATRIESFGIAIVEALASGTPVISTNVGGIPDIIKNEINGYLIDYNDHETMASRSIYLLYNKSIYDKFVQEGLKTAQLYSSAYLGPKLKTLLETVIYC